MRRRSDWREGVTQPLPPNAAKGERGETHKRYTGGLREGIGMKPCLHGPMDYAKKPKLHFRVRDLDLPEIRYTKYSSSREEEDVDAVVCPCGVNNTE